MRWRSLIRVLIFVPYVIAEVIVATGWSLMLQTTGAVNGLLDKMGLSGWTVDWLADPSVAIWSLMVIISWKYIGLSLIHISEPTRLGMISYAVFCLKKK